MRMKKKKWTVGRSVCSKMTAEENLAGGKIRRETVRGENKLLEEKPPPHYSLTSIAKRQRNLEAPRGGGKG